MSAWLLAVLLPFAYAWGFWNLYVLIMGFYRAHLSKQLRGIALWMALPSVVVGYLVDLLANWTFASWWFMEFPRSPLELVTDRLSRYIDGPPGWHQRHAQWVCSTFLDYFDPAGTHCK